MSTINVSIPDQYHAEDVPRGEIAALYVDMLLRLGRQPRKQMIECERPNGEPYTTTVVYRHPVTNDVLMQFTIRHD
jgi:hypothetical protein